MKGIYDKTALHNLIEPLKAISDVYSTAVPVVYECDDDGIFIGTIDENKSIFVFHNFKAKEFIKDYQNPIKEIGIHDVKQFIHILQKYCDKAYTEDVSIEPIDNKLVINCGNETLEYYLTDLSMIGQFRSKVRRMRSEILTKACEFELSGIDLKKLSSNVGIFNKDADEVSLSSNRKTNEIVVKIYSSMSANHNKVSMRIGGIGTISEAFDMRFKKEVFEGLLDCNDKFNIVIYTGNKNIIEVTYAKEAYDMKFYLVPLA